MPADSGADRFLDETIGQYRIVREIGRGGMGVVYEAVHARIGQRVAVKTLSPRLAKDTQALERFFQEARACALIEHEGIPKIFDFGQTASGTQYILMELLRGESLRSRLARSPQGRLTLTETLRVGRQVATALDAAHEKGIIHRDLKPENVILISDSEALGGERAKVLDFGIAKILEPNAELSAQDLILGTPTYMAPEQCLGDPVTDGRTDVYALGIMLYEMLGGRPPYEGHGEDLLRVRLFEEPAPLRALRSDLPDELERLVARMLSKSMSERPPMREVATTLSELRSGPEALPPVGSGPPQAPSQARLPVGGARTETAGGNPRKLRALPAAEERAHVGPRRMRPALRAIVGLLALAGLGATTLIFRGRGSGMVAVPGGSFMMGSSAEEIQAAFRWAQRSGCPECGPELYDRERPARQVVLSPFRLDRTEVTCTAFAAWLNRQPDLRVEGDRRVFAGPALLIDLYSAYGYSGIVYRERHFSTRPGMEARPVSLVTWSAAEQYCQGAGARLPTEAEWEYAVRGGAGFRFPWGDDEPHCEGVTFGRGPGGPCLQSGTGTRDVATSPQDRTALGIWDLGANVAEWVYDAYTPNYPLCGKSCVNPRVERAADDGGEEVRVVRGGAWYRKAEAVRGAGRSRRKKSEVSGDIGFRCAR